VRQHAGAQVLSGAKLGRLGKGRRFEIDVPSWRLICFPFSRWVSYPSQANTMAGLGSARRDIAELRADLRTELRADLRTELRLRPSATGRASTPEPGSRPVRSTLLRDACVCARRVEHAGLCIPMAAATLPPS